MGGISSVRHSKQEENGEVRGWTGVGDGAEDNEDMYIGSKDMMLPQFG